MKDFNLKYFVFLLFLLPDVLYGQSKITVTKPRLEVSDDNLTITYDILNSKSSDFFVVWIEITDVNGNKIKAISVSGDIGKDIKGGRNKRITWNFITDSLFIDEDLFVEVKAEKVVLQEETAETKTTKESEVKDNGETKGATKTQNVDTNKILSDNKEINDNKETIENKVISENKTKTELEEEKRTPVKEEGSKKEISKSKMVLTSAVLPGWGQTKANKGKPFWIIGAAGYGCIAGSILMNRSASSAYDDYKSSMDLDESNSLFDRAIKRNNFSKVLGYSAIGIWAADLIWVLATPVKSSISTVTLKNRKLRITPGFDISSNYGVVSLTYKF